MKASCFVASWFGRVVLASVGLSAISLGSCQCGPTTPSQPSTTGSLSISLGFGAVTSPGYQCNGGGSVKISSPAGVPQTQTYSYSGLSGSSSPACSTNITFANLQPGTWTIEVQSKGITCPTKQVTAGQTATATIREEGTCQ
jgi:hypothetical protein